MRKVQVLDQRLWPGRRRYRFSLAPLGEETYTAHVLWIDEETATEPLELVLEGEKGDTRVLTAMPDSTWRLGTTRGEGGTIVNKIEFVPSPPRRRAHGGLDELLVIKRDPA